MGKTAEVTLHVDERQEREPPGSSSHAGGYAADPEGYEDEDSFDPFDLCEDEEEAMLSSISTFEALQRYLEWRIYINL